MCVLLATVVGFVGAGTAPARADETPSATAEPAPGGTGATGSPTPDPLLVESGVPDHGTRPPPGPVVPVIPPPGPPAVDAELPSPVPTPVPTEERSTDGVGLSTGQADLYLALVARRQTASLADTAAQASLATARAKVVSLKAEAARLALGAQEARAAVTRTQASTDDVAALLYQQGDGGLGALGTILMADPDGVLERLSTVTLLNSVATKAVNDSVTARQQLDMADFLLWSLQSDLDEARSAEKRAADSAAATSADLASLDAELTALEAVAPEVAVGIDGCPRDDVPGALRGGAESIGAERLCVMAVTQAATPQAALAIAWAFQHLGASYACGGSGRLLPFRADCSSFVSRAYHEGAGLATAGTGWAASTRDMVPWDGVTLDPHYALVIPEELLPGDLVLYDTCPRGGCPYKHVVMYLGSPDGGRTSWMIHTDSCGDVAKVEPFWGFATSGHPFLVARRVVPLPGEKVVVPERSISERTPSRSSLPFGTRAVAPTG
jgi:cell wall-associated NlpC family hydrolase